jgi:hypothetical protein
MKPPRRCNVRRHGHTGMECNMDDSTLRRFESKYVVDDNGCWIWTSKVDKDGYARIWIDRARSSYAAYRLSYEHYVGPIPAGLTIDHLCRVPGCVNAQHMEPVTMAENLRRRFNGDPNRCKNGHEFTVENTGFRKRPGKPPARRCLECHRLETVRRRAKPKGSKR